MSREFALVTGASKGLGKAFAFELSKRKINTILIGLPDEGLGLLPPE
jgi:short-subunit dehydrogenase